MFRWAFPGAIGLLALTGCASAQVRAAPSVPPQAPASGPVTLLAPVPAPGQPPPGLLTASAKLPALESGPAPAHDELSLPSTTTKRSRGPPAPPPRTLPRTRLGPPLTDAEVDHRYHHDPPRSAPPPWARRRRRPRQRRGHARGEHWQLLDPGRAWGTQETVDALVRVIERVNERFPGAPPLAIGHLSAKHRRPPQPPQAATSPAATPTSATTTRRHPPLRPRHGEDNLDLPRTWALLKAALNETTIDMIFIDRNVQRVLADYAARAGEDLAFLDHDLPGPRQERRRPDPPHPRPRQPHPLPLAQPRRRRRWGSRVARFVVIPRAPARRHDGARPRMPPPRASPPVTRRSARAAGTRS